MPITIDSTWHAERVAQYRGWIEFAKEQVAWAKQMLEQETKHLAQCEQWLDEAIADQKKFEEREAQP